MTTATATATAGLVGNLASDPELRFSAAGKPWCTLRLAVKPWLRGADVQPEPIYYDVVAFGLLAEHVCESLHKGDRVVVSGRIEAEPWTGRDGVERVTQKIIAGGIGLDLRFTGTTSPRPKATEPATPRPDTTIDGLLTPGRGYADEPF
jgi:single-strand DNA-binding protein